MPRFAANLSMMFQEVGFLDRFDAAARAGFKAVEFLFPYEHPPETIAERLEKNRLTLALFNTVPGDWAGGERGLAARPGRDQEFHDGVDKAILYAKASKCRLLHTMAGLWPEGRDKGSG
jgi:hydroxypyruvate isomerase